MDRERASNPERGRDPEGLDDRKASILRAIVEEYVSTAQPVGSNTVVQTRGLGVSAATVRNEMSVLERDGYIVQPHTSAGRVPTDKGYRYFVDHFAAVAALPQPQRRQVADFFASTSRVMDDLLHETSQLLARMTHHAAVVVGPQVEVTRISAVSLVALDPQTTLLVVVLSDGVVEKATVRTLEPVEEATVAAAQQRLTAHLQHSDFAALSAPPAPPAGDDDAHTLATDAVDALARHLHEGGEPLFVGGASRLAAEQQAFASPAAVSRLLELLEQQVVMVALVRELLGPGLTVTIGSENPREDLQECSLVLAPYLVEGALAGTIGVLGPTRMDYRQAQAAVATISQQLSRRLSS